MIRRLFRVRIAVQVNPQHVELVCTGIYSRAEALRLGEEAYRQASLADRINLLIDVRKITGRLPTILDRYDFGVHIAEQYLSSDPRIRLALLGHEPMIHPERFGELVARNRGADARVFTDETLALDWLLGRPA
jgi:hypothetical protein